MRHLWICTLRCQIEPEEGAGVLHSTRHETPCVTSKRHHLLLVNPSISLYADIHVDSVPFEESMLPHVSGGSTLPQPTRSGDHVSASHDRAGMIHSCELHVLC